MLTKRTVAAVDRYNGFEVKPKTDPSLILENVAQQTMTGMLNQLAYLSVYAAELYTDILGDTSKITQKMTRLGERAEKLYNAANHCEDTMMNRSIQQLLRNPKLNWKAKRSEDDQHLSRSSIPSSMADIYNRECSPLPNVGILDNLRTDGKSGVKDYSNPSFFIDEWVTDQRKHQEEARAKRAERKAQREEQAKKNMAKDASVRQVRRIEIDRHKLDATGLSKRATAPTVRDDTSILRPSLRGQPQTQPQPRSTMAQAHTQAQAQLEPQSQRTAATKPVIGVAPNPLVTAVPKFIESDPAPRFRVQALFSRQPQVPEDVSRRQVSSKTSVIVTQLDRHKTKELNTIVTPAKPVKDTRDVKKDISSSVEPPFAPAGESITVLPPVAPPPLLAQLPSPRGVPSQPLEEEKTLEKTFAEPDVITAPPPTPPIIPTSKAKEATKKAEENEDDSNQKQVAVAANVAIAGPHGVAANVMNGPNVGRILAKRRRFLEDSDEEQSDDSI